MDSNLGGHITNNKQYGLTLHTLNKGEVVCTLGDYFAINIDVDIVSTLKVGVK